MTTDEMMCGSTTNASVRFVEEGRPGPIGAYGATEREVTVRSWDVTDPQARYDAAVEEWPDMVAADKNQAMWFIDPDRNAAAFCVFRPAAA